MLRILSGPGAWPRHGARRIAAAVGASSDRLRSHQPPAGASRLRLQFATAARSRSRGEEQRVRVWRLVPSVLVAALVLQLAPRAAQVPADPVPCTFPPGEIAWLQRALDSWNLVSREFLRIDPSPLPWIVLVDASCVWHLSSDRTVIREPSAGRDHADVCRPPGPGACAQTPGHGAASERGPDVGRDEGQHGAVSQRPRHLCRHGDAVGVADERRERADARRVSAGRLQPRDDAHAPARRHQSPRA